MGIMSYTTDLAKDECLQRLKKHARRGGWLVPWAEGTIAAKICGDHFRLFAWGPLNVEGITF